MAKQFTEIEVVVTSISKRGGLKVFGLANGAIEVEMGSHDDLPRVDVGANIRVKIGLAEKKKLDAGNAVAAQFLGAVIATSTVPVASPRQSDSRSS